MNDRIHTPLANLVCKPLIFATALAIVVVLTGAVLYGRSPASFRGKLVARYDLLRGRKQVLLYGLRPERLTDCERELQQRYGLRFRIVAGCVVTSSLMQYVDAYNRVVRERLVREYGRDALEHCESR